MQKILFPDLPKRTPEIRITPLIDILLLLLIFFTISSRLRWNPGLTLDLPQASSSVPVDRPLRLVVMIDEEGTMYLQGEEVAADALGAELKAASPSSARNRRPWSSKPIEGLPTAASWASSTKPEDSDSKRSSPSPKPQRKRCSRSPSEKVCSSGATSRT